MISWFLFYHTSNSIWNINGSVFKLNLGSVQLSLCLLKNPYLMQHYFLPRLLQLSAKCALCASDFASHSHSQPSGQRDSFTFEVSCLSTLFFYKSPNGVQTCSGSNPKSLGSTRSSSSLASLPSSLATTHCCFPLHSPSFFLLWYHHFLSLGNLCYSDSSFL